MDKIKSKINSLYYRLKDKCYNPKNNKYKIYGARGIKVCDEWLNNKELFVKWCYESGIKENLTLDRIDVNGNYEPNNCRWITLAEQSRNKRDTLYLTIDNKTQLVKYENAFNDIKWQKLKKIIKNLYVKAEPGGLEHCVTAYIYKKMQELEGEDVED